MTVDLRRLPADLRDPVVEDGRVVEVTVGDVGALPDGAAAIFRALPDLRALTLQNAGNRVVGVRLDGRAFGRVPELRQLVALRCFFCEAGDDGLEGLAASPHLRGLHELVVYDDPNVTDFGLEALGRARWPALEAMRLWRIGAGPTGVAALVRADWPNLRHLAVERAAIGDAGAEALAAGRLRPTRLGLSQSGVGAAGARALAEAGWTDAVAWLALNHTPLGPEGVRALASGFAGLTALELVAVGAEEGAVAALCAAPFAARLDTLHLSGQPVGPGGARALAAVPFVALRGLGLSRAGLDVDAVRALAAAGVLRGLRSLSLAGAPLGAAGVAALGELPALERLDLGGCGLGDAGAAALVRISAPLQHVDLAEDDLGDAAAAELAGWASLGTCTALLLARNRIGDAGAAALAAALPGLRRLDLSRNRVSPGGQEALKRTALWASGAQVDLADNDGPQIAVPAGPAVGGVEGQLVAALVREPADPAAGAVWCDWLDGQGDARGALARVQLALEALAPGDPAAGPLEDAAAAWLRDHGARLLAPLRALGLHDRFEPFDAVTLRAGVVSGVTFHADVDLAAVGDALLAAAPGLTELRAFGKVEHLVDSPVLPRLRRLSSYAASPVQALADAPAASGLRRLGLRAGAGAAAVLAASPHLAGLEALDLGFAKFGDDGARTLVGPASRLHALRRLDLLGCGLGPGAGEAFGASALPLEVLGLRSNRLGDDGVRGLTRGAHRWKELELTGNGVSPDALEALLRSPTAGELLSITLQGNPLADPGAAVLAEHLPASLRHLDLGRCGLTSGGLVRVVSSPQLAGLAGFWLLDTPVDAAAAAAIGRLPGARRLSLYGCELDDLAIAALIREDGGALQWLSLGNATFGPRGAEALAASPRLGTVRALLLGGVPIGDAGLSSLARSPHLHALRELGLNGAGVGPEGLHALAAGGAAAGLRKLNLWKNPAVGDADLHGLAAATPHLAHVDLSETGVTFEGLLALIEGPAWPHLAVLAARQIVPSSQAAERRRLEGAVAARRPGLSLSG